MRSLDSTLLQTEQPRRYPDASHKMSPICKKKAAEFKMTVMMFDIL